MLTHLESNPFKLEFVGKVDLSDELLADMLSLRVGTIHYMDLYSALLHMQRTCHMTFGS